MIKKNFEQWLFEEVENTFDIQNQDSFKELEEWTSVEKKMESLPFAFERLRVSLFQNVKIWNEDELKMMFIAPFLLEFNFNHLPNYRVFSQRYFSFQTQDIEASGKIEWLIATGKQTPKKPFFFLQEYKPEKNSGNDPLGQLLIAMVDAQILNQDPTQTLYGCYTIGRFWFFVVLKEKIYGVSRAYDATQIDDLGDMIIILKRVKKYIHTQLNISFEEEIF